MLNPFTSRIRFEGSDEVAALHRDIFAVLDDLTTSDPLALGDTASFSFRARRRGPLVGALVALLTWPLAFALRTADRFAPRLV